MITPGLEDTIYALASAAGSAPLAIIRLSGPRTPEILSELGYAPNEVSNSKATRKTARLSLSNALSLPAIVLTFPAPRSYTGQHCAELYLPGCTALTQAVLNRLADGGVRAALPGEFTVRALLNGKLSAAQATSVLDLIHSASAAEARTAARRLLPGTTTVLTTIRQELINLLAAVEAGIDFAEEEDIRFVEFDLLETRLRALEEQLSELKLRQDQAAPAASAVPTVLLAGLPNAGKSTLFNALVGKPRALTSPLAGTTRDVLSARVVLGGVLVDLLDSAGIAEPRDLLDAAAQLRAHAALPAADLVIWVHDARLEWLEAECRLLGNSGDQSIIVLSHCDLTSARGAPGPAIVACALDGTGLDELGQAVTERLRANCDNSSSSDRVQLVCASLVRAQAAAASGVGELVAFELREAVYGLTAEFESLDEALLGKIFATFCIGK